MHAGYIRDLPPAGDIVSRAVSSVASGSARIRAVGARLAELTHVLASYRAPPMPPELVAKVDQALAAEVARSSSVSLPGPRSAPAARLADGADEWRNWNIRIPMPREPEADS